MLTRDDINSFLIQIKGYVDSSNAVLKKELIEFVNSKNQELKNYVDTRTKNSENNLTEVVEQKLDSIKGDLYKQLGVQFDRMLSESNNNYILLSSLKNDVKELKKELTEIKKKAIEAENKIKNIKNVL